MPFPLLIGRSFNRSLQRLVADGHSTKPVRRVISELSGALYLPRERDIFVEIILAPKTMNVFQAQVTAGVFLSYQVRSDGLFLVLVGPAGSPVSGASQGS